MLAGACAIVFGFAHFNYIDFTASMVPGWIPFKTFWAWATGAGHLAAGLALVSGIKARLGVTCEAAMMGSFAVLLHLPRVVAAPDQHVAVRNRARDVLPIKSAVETDGGVDPLHDLRRTARIAAAPHRVGTIRRLGSGLRPSRSRVLSCHEY